jgi:lipid A 3-O-deacylase
MGESRATDAARAAILVTCACALSLVAVPSVAFDQLEVEGGGGNHVAVLGLSVGTADWKRWEIADNWVLGLRGKTGIDLWVGLDHDTPNKYVWDFGAYPILRLETSDRSEHLFYVEASVGVNLLSHTRINDNRVFSTAFQFGEFIGAGVTFGEWHQYSLGLRLQHVSNGDIKRPNDGLTYGAVVFQCRLDSR